jgi:hypothetical protein
MSWRGRSSIPWSSWTVPARTPRVYTHPKNLGYGGNQKMCQSLALELGDDIVITVHSHWYTPKLIPAMMSTLASGLYPCVLESRILGNYALEVACRSGSTWRTDS